MTFIFVRKDINIQILVQILYTFINQFPICNIKYSFLFIEYSMLMTQVIEIKFRVSSARFKLSPFLNHLGVPIP